MDNPLRVTKKFSLYKESTTVDGTAPEQLVDPPIPPDPPEPPYVTGGPPFPQRATDSGRYGISILDYFAAHVMTGLAMRADISLDDLKIDGAKHAYWIAAMMVNLRDELQIEPTPVPAEEEPPFVLVPPVNTPETLQTSVRVTSAPTA